MVRITKVHWVIVKKKEIPLKSHLCKSPGVTHSQTTLAIYLEAT